MGPLQNAPQRRQEYFAYSTGRLAAIAVGATVNTQILIQADADFLIEKLTYYADLAGVAQTSGARIVPNVTVLITASSSGVQIMNNPVPIPAMFGTGDLPFILPTPRLLGANSQLQIQLVSFEAAVTPLITLNFHGRKIYALERRV